MACSRTGSRALAGEVRHAGQSPLSAAAPLPGRPARGAPRHDSPCSSSGAAAHAAAPPTWRPSPLRRRSRAAPRPPCAQAAPGVGVFPAGQRQARVELPALMLQLDASQALDSPQLLESVDRAIAAGATAVVLAESAAGGAAALYEAALKLKSLLAGRAALLLVDRTDIASAVGAEGVVLTDAGEWWQWVVKGGGGGQRACAGLAQPCLLQP